MVPVQAGTAADPGTQTWTGVPAARQAPPWAWLALGAVALAFVITIAAGTAIWLAGRGDDAPEDLTAGGPAASAEASDECAIGTWTLISSLRMWDIAGTQVQMSSQSPSVLSIRPDGTMEADYGDGHRETGSHPGLQYEVLATGTITLDYAFTGDGGIITSNQRADGELVVWLNGVQISREPLRPSVEPAQYICDGDTLIVQDSTGTMEYRRAG